MPQYTIEISDEYVVTVDLPPNAPRPRDIDFDFEATTEQELRELIPLLGFDPTTMQPNSTLYTRYGIPMCCDGEQVGKTQVSLWIKGGLIDPPEPRPIPALERIIREARQAQAAAEALRHKEGAVAWAREHGRPVKLIGGEVREDA